MTLVVALTGTKSIWLMADRRLTYPTKQRNDACKVITVEGSDGVAFLGYAGLGASTHGTEPSAWMNDLLAGMPIQPLEAYLGAIADALQVELPRQLLQMQGRKAHFVLAPALMDTKKPRLYGISLEVTSKTEPPRFVYTRYSRTDSGGPPPRIALAGSGAGFVAPVKTWYRDLFRILVAYERGLVAPEAVSDRLAVINEKVAAKDRFVSPECIVKWRGASGGFQFYSGAKRVEADVGIPTVANGMDIQAIAKIVMPMFARSVEAHRRGDPAEMDSAEIQAELDKLALKPRRKL